MTDIDNIIKKEFKITDRQLNIIKIIFMIGLIITMIIVAIVIWKYGSAIQSNPCDFCDCTFKSMKGGLK